MDTLIFEVKSMGKLEQNEQEASQSFISTVAVIGFVGGALWSLVAYFAYTFKFIPFGPAVILEPWALGDWKTGTLGQWLGILAIAIISIGVAFLYRVLLAKFNSIWPGIVFGFVLWLVVFVVLHPLFNTIDPITEMNRNTLTTSISLYVVYGLFIGYSVSYEYHERTVHEGESIQE
ncbi:hypothetical protein CR203_01550 [Salipaludibacillus neizhouensis]|uniref:Membrane protein YqhR n=2 Tax=Salipaludibacillus neizhouensis TaxID=885475 RepID=A0A3A9K993_9BACI|nr:hypothetical protein CR203_01550 [Salipaludibacillus neizhouensis]